MDNFSDLVGRTLVSVEETDYAVYFEADNGDRWKLYHEQDCCESVIVEDVIGDLDCLVGTPILHAEEKNDCDYPEDSEINTFYYDESHTWTFYDIRTIKGDVTIRWFGASNGYYSESVDFRKL